MIRLVVYSGRDTIELDTYGDENINITYAVDDLRDIESKTGDYSKVFDLPATKTNNRYFGYLHDLQSDVSQYDTLNGQKCELFINGISVFEGLLYLNEIVKLDNETKYKVNLLGESVRLLEVLGDATLADLDFTDFSHNFTNTNITSITGVTNTAGNVTEGIQYSLIQNLGLLSNSNGDITQMIGSKNVQPFVRMWNIIQKIFSYAGFQYESNFFDSTLKEVFMDTGLNDNTIEGTSGAANRFIGHDSSQGVNVVSSPYIDWLFAADKPPSYGGSNAQLTATDRYQFDNVHNITTSYTQLPFNFEPQFNYGTIPNDAGNILGTNGLVTSPADNFEVAVVVRVQIFATENETISIIARQTEAGTGTVTDHIMGEFTMPDISNSIFFQQGGASQQQINYRNFSCSIGAPNHIVLNAGDTLTFQIKKSGGDAWVARYRHVWTPLQGYAQGNPIPPNACADFLNQGTNAGIGVDRFYKGDNPVVGTTSDVDHLNAMCLSLTKSTNYNGNRLQVYPVGLTPDAIQHKIHTNHGDVKLADIIKDLTKMFNLVIENRNGILKIEPYSTFIASGSSKDWSSKIDTTEIVQNYERVPSKITWRYNNDEDDAMLNQYKAVTGEEYGSMTIELPVDYVDEKEIKLDVFSAMAYVHLGSGTRYSACYGIEDGVYENIENKPRLIFKHPFLVSASIVDFTNIYTDQSYRALGHFDAYPTALTATSESLNFGYTQNQFIAPSFTAPQNLYNKYWFNYINERYTAERVLVKCKAYLTETDIQAFSFADIITVQNQQYRVVKIEYSAGQSGLAKLQMIKI